MIYEKEVYENSLVHLMRKDGINVGQYFADIFVENKIILELKVCEKIRPEHEAQLTKFHRTFSRCSSLTLSVLTLSVLTLSVLIFMGIGG